jgi:hypothetical protein
LSYVTRSISIVRNPANDRVFARAVEEIAESGVTDPEVAQERLRERYPQAVVRPRDLAGETSGVWYVYRDGHWIPGDSGGDGE